MTPAPPRGSVPGRDGHGPPGLCRPAGPEPSGYPGQPTATAPSPRRPANPLAASGRAPRAVGTTAPTARRSQSGATGRAHAPRAESLASLADMMTRCIELRGEIKIAKVDIDCAENERDRRVAKIRMRTTEEQLDAVRTMPPAS